MVTQAYKAYLKSEDWRKKRQQVFAHYGKRCYACTTLQGPFHVHHLSYAYLGREPLADLMPLCIPCHREVTKLYRRNRRRGLRRVTLEFVRYKREKNKANRRASN